MISKRKRILLSRADIFKVLAITNIEVTSPGSLWVEVTASSEDLMILKNLSYKYSLL